MPHVLVRHRVDDYSKWNAQLHRDADVRKFNGSVGGRVYRLADDPHEVVTLIAWDRMDQARDFMRSWEFRALIEQAGQTDPLEVLLLDEVEELLA